MFMGRANNIDRLARRRKKEEVDVESLHQKVKLEICVRRILTADNVIKLSMHGAVLTFV